jgi:selenocysteine lyase/cysteine desulfurase
MLAAYYSEYFKHCGEELHVAAHSHHPWPDVARAAHLQYWDDSAQLTGSKWAKIFGEVVPQAQAHIARLLQLDDPEWIAFAPNAHEFAARLLSCLDWSQPRHLITTDAEFHSFGRQAKRLEETGRLRVTRVPAEPFASFTGRFVSALAEPHDMVWLSQVFFDSGFVVGDLPRIVDRCAPDALVAIDGYHAFCALPVDLSAIQQRVFYVAGGYKYAQSGEGCAFLAIPPGCALRPLATGWFSEFGLLDAQPTAHIGYGEKAFRFWGSTFDASGLYRFNAVMGWLQQLGATPEQIHVHAGKLQRQFLDWVGNAKLTLLPANALIPPADTPRGNFCTFDLDAAETAERRLTAEQIRIDRRGRRLRFGFGIYQDAAFVERLCERTLRALAAT